MSYYNKGQTLVGWLVVVLIAGLVSGGFYLYLESQSPEVSDVLEKAEEEATSSERTKQPEESPGATTSKEKPTCQDQCSSVNQKKCSDSTHYKVCGNYDSDPCLEWSTSQVCSPEEICSEGQCKTEYSAHSYKKCYSNALYWYDSQDQRKEKVKDCGSDSCQEWSSNFCENNKVYHQRTCYNRGCSNNSCYSDSYNGKEMVEECDAEGSCQNGQCIQQKCVDGTPYGECSTNKPKYCENGKLINDAGQCGCRDGYKVSGSKCTVKIPDFTTKPGLVVIRKGAEGKDFARRVSSAKGWKFLAVGGTSDEQQIRERIINSYNRERFYYLLIFGDNSQIPIANSDLLADFYSSNQDYDEFWDSKNVLDSIYYGNVDNDPFVELAVGRLPFNDKTSFENYYLNLEKKKKIRSINAFRPSTRPGSLSMTTIRKALLNFRVDNFITRTLNETEISRYLKNSDLFLFFSHGSENSFEVNGGYSWHELPNLRERRPIIISGACSTAKVFGREFVKKGGSAFIGYYFSAQPNNNPFPIRPLNKGDSIGKSVRGVINRSIAIHKWKPETFFPSFYYLIGDPSLKIDSLETGEYSKLNLESEKNQIVINIPPYQKEVSYEVSDEGEMLLFIDGNGRARWNLKSWPLNLYNNRILDGEYSLVEDSWLESPEIFVKCDPSKESNLYTCMDIDERYQYIKDEIPYKYAASYSLGENFFAFRVDENYDISDFYFEVEGERYTLSKYSRYKIISSERENFLVFRFSINDFLDLARNNKLFKGKKVILKKE